MPASVQSCLYPPDQIHTVLAPPTPPHTPSIPFPPMPCSARQRGTLACLAAVPRAERHELAPQLGGREEAGAGRHSQRERCTGGACCPWRGTSPACCCQDCRRGGGDASVPPALPCSACGTSRHVSPPRARPPTQLTGLIRHFRPATISLEEVPGVSLYGCAPCMRFAPHKEEGGCKSTKAGHRHRFPA